MWKLNELTIRKEWKYIYILYKYCILNGIMSNTYNGAFKIDKQNICQQSNWHFKGENGLIFLRVFYKMINQLYIHNLIWNSKQRVSRCRYLLIKIYDIWTLTGHKNFKNNLMTPRVCWSTFVQRDSHKISRDRGLPSAFFLSCSRFTMTTALIQRYLTSLIGWKWQPEALYRWHW